MGGVRLTMTAKNNLLWIFLRILEMGMQILVFFIILLMLSYHIIGVSAAGIVGCLATSGLPVLALYLVRLLIKNNILIVVCHTAVAAFLLIRGVTPEEKLAYILLGVALLIYSFSLSNSDKKGGAEKIPIGFLTLFVVAAMLGKSAGLENIKWAGIYGGSIFIILQVLYLNFDNVNKYLCMNQEIAHLPVKQIVAVNTFQMSILVTLFCGIMILFSNKYVNRMVEIISGFVGGFITYIFRMIFSLGKDYKPKSVLTGGAGEGNGMDQMWAIVEESIWTDILNAIGMIFGSVIGVVLVIGFCVLIIVVVVKRLKNISFGGESDVKEFIVPGDVAEFQWRRKMRGKQEKGSGINYKARMLFKSHVIKAAARQGEQIRATMMPRELSGLYLGVQEKDVADIYEKARYSKENVTSEEIAVLKKLKV